MQDPTARMEKKGLLAVALIALCLPALAGTSPDLEKARALSVGCLGCHGERYEGQGSLPPLRTLDRQTFILRFEAYLREEQSASVMHRIARGYSPEEIRLMADFLAKGSRP